MATPRDRMQSADRALGRAQRAMLALENAVHESGLERSLLKLVKMRASQINGCAHCLDMHSKDALAAGERIDRLVLLDAWDETPPEVYSARERAALQWTEAVTLVADGHVPDAAYAAALTAFSEDELVDLTLAVVAINGWNRLAISSRAHPGHYQPAREAAVAAGG
jgi:AhpD family alkylhydroperoxidase